jgi:hypothetical protein
MKMTIESLKMTNFDVIKCLKFGKCSFRGSTSLAKTWQILIECYGSWLILASLTLSSQGLNFSKQISLKQSWMAQISAIQIFCLVHLLVQE